MFSHIIINIHKEALRFTFHEVALFLLFPVVIAMRRISSRSEPSLRPFALLIESVGMSAQR
jgi:hypothetical protein